LNLPDGARFSADSLRFTWMPTFEQSGEYPDVTFIVSDGSGLNDSKATKITVNHVNRPPQLSQIQPQVVDENTALNFDLIGDDPDVEDQGKLHFSASGLPEGALLDANNFSWTPTYDQSGMYTVEFQLSDGLLTDIKSAQVTVNHVNRPPILEPITAQVVDENLLLEFTVVGNDPDQEDAGKWTISAAQIPTGAQFNSETAMFTWTPDFDQAGIYTVQFTNTDEQGLSTAQDAQITVNHINRTPLFNALAAQTVDENSPLTITIPPGEDPDVEDAQKLTYTVQNSPQGAVFDETNLTFSWTPDFEQSGSYEMQFACTDGEFTVTQPLQIEVRHVNRPPEVESIADQTIDENSPFALTVTYNDPDKEDEGQITLSVTNLPSGATFDLASAEISWTPAFDQAGTYQEISISAADPGGLQIAQNFAITVNNVNRAPSLQAVEKLTGAENETIMFQFPGSDPDMEDEGKLQYAADNLPRGAVLDPATGAFNWTPDFTQAGTYDINIKLSDPGGLTAAVALPVEVINVNRPPAMQSIEDITVDENSSVTVVTAASDEDSDDQLSYNAAELPAGATLSAENGALNWTPTYDQAGDYMITVTVSDGAAEASQTFNINVNNVNRVPVIEVPGSATVTAGETVEMNFTSTDADDDALTFESSDLPDGAVLDANSGTFIWTPTEEQVGTFNFSVTVSDGTDSAAATANVTVNPVPAPPPPQEEPGQEN
jgi:hypothetical protein